MSKRQNENELVKFHGRIGERIRKAREERLCSQKKLSQISGLSQSQISRIESGERAVSLYSLIKISLALHVNPGYLIEAEPERLAKLI